ncbi:MAG: corrinoid protein [Anaerolineales bacterium]|nr:corrinoid protein [Anaerolineales bacterium]
MLDAAASASLPTAEEIYQGLFDNTVLGKVPDVKALTQAGLAQGMDPVKLLYDALLPALQEVGRRFETGEFFVPEMLMSARAMQGALNLLRPLLAAKGEKSIGKVVMGTVKGDVHDIGKNLCNIMLEGAGFEVIDLGVNTAPEKFVDAVRTHQPHILGMSAFLTTTMPMIKVTVEALKKAELRDTVKVLAGGAPVTDDYAVRLSGADAYCPDASATARKAKELVGVAGEAPGGALAVAVKAVEQMMGNVEE